MKKTIRSLTAFLLAAGLGCTALFCTGCANTDSAAETSSAETGKQIYVPEKPENPVSEDEPGTDYEMKIGDAMQYEDKLDVTLNQVVEVDDVNKSAYRVLLAEITIKNNTTEKIDCSSLVHFSIEIDGAPDTGALRDVQAAVVGRKYYTAIGSDLQNFNSEIPAGTETKGYIYIYAPSAWKEMKLIYTPYRYYSNDRIIMTLDEAAFTHYTEKLPTN